MGLSIQTAPAETNCNQLCTQLLGDVVFSQRGRVMRSGEQLTVTLSAPEGTPSNAEIRFTMDGSEPTSSSPIYSTPFQISQNRIIRATLFCNGYLSPRSTTNSYIFMPREVTLPVVSMVTNGRYLTDSKIGIYVEGSYKAARRTTNSTGGDPSTSSTSRTRARKAD